MRAAHFFKPKGNDMEATEKPAFLKIASSVAKAAGDRLSAIRERRVNSDAGNDVKLQGDVESEMFIREKLEPTGIPVIGEENGGDASLAFSDSYYWIVDPIDGTYNYLRGIPGVCVSVALMKGRKPIVGAINDFTRGELYAGGAGLPLSLNGSEIRPAWAREISQAVLMTGFPSATDYSEKNLRHFIMSLQKFKKVRMCGSAALAMAWVASGRADAYKESRLYLWDVAAGLSLMESAGGECELEFLGIEGKPLCVSIQAVAGWEFFTE